MQYLTAEIKALKNIRDLLLAKWTAGCYADCYIDDDFRESLTAQIKKPSYLNR